MKSFKTICGLLSVVFLMSGCNYLDIVPEDDTLSTNKIFQTRTGALQWMNDAYDNYSYQLAHWNANPAILGGDEYVGNDYSRKSRVMSMFYIADGLQNSLQPYNDIWAYNNEYKYIRLCNTFLAKIGDVANLRPGELEQWTAEVKALKAFYYFEMIKRYGPFVLVPENIDVWESLDNMRKPRNTVDECFNAIVQLLDEAIPDLQLYTDKNAEMQYLMSKEGAMGLKSRVLLYAASPLFNGGVPQYRNLKNRDGVLLFPQQEDKEKWRVAAEYADEVITYLESRGYKLVQGTNNQPTPMLNKMRDLELSIWETSNMTSSTESIMLTELFPFCNEQLPILGSSSTDYYFNPQAAGALCANMKMVNKFYTANGLPIEEDKTWQYGNGYQMAVEKDPAYTQVVPLDQDVLALHLRREPRFYATIAAPGTYWRVGTYSSDNLLVDARQGQLFGLKSNRLDPAIQQNITGYFVKKGLRSDCNMKDYLNNLRSKVGYGGVAMRLAEIYLNAAEAWNEYEGPNGAHHDKIFDRLNKIRERAGIPTVQESWSTYGTNPEKYTVQLGLRDIIHRERTIELMYEGHRFWDVRRWGAALEEGFDKKPIGWKVTGKTWTEFYNNFQGPVEVWNKAAFNPNRDYLWPIRSEEVNISGITQNPGW